MSACFLLSFGVVAARGISNGHGQTKLGRAKTGALEVGGFSIEGVSIGGQETCVMVPAYKVAFDSGRCPERLIHQDFLFITHPHMDHIVSFLYSIISPLQIVDCSHCLLCFFLYHVVN
jgi:ribonuclease Z